MNVLIVYAHHEPTSFTAAMKNVAADVLSGQGHGVVISDLYGEGFNALAQKWDFVTMSGSHFNYMLEQKHAAQLSMSFAPDITGEIQKIQAADLILFVTPIWWLSVPAILKGWFDRVLAMGVAWNGGQIFEKGLMRGKQAMIIGAAGGPADFFSENGRYRATPVQLLHPINHGTLAFCGFNVHEPYVALDVLGTSQAGREEMLRQLGERLNHIFDSPQWLVYY